MKKKKLSRFEGAGVYYSATFVEAQLCGGEVIVVGRGNAAGQVAVFLAETAKIAQMLVRSAGLVENMSSCLIRRIEETPKIVLRPHPEIVALEGGDHLESVRWRNSQIEHREEHKTGSDLSPENLSAARWPLFRQPYLLETSLPGVFAVGDVRGGSVKRVASAMGMRRINRDLIYSQNTPGIGNRTNVLKTAMTMTFAHLL